MRPIASLLTLAATVVLTAACAPGDTAADAPPPAPATPERAFTTEGFATPESVRWDSAGARWFVSNINGNPSAKDGNGFIERLGPDGARLDSVPFIAGGSNGVTLHAPKGMAIADGVLWVADIDAVRGFDVATGAPVASLELAALGAVFLNDVAATPDGKVYVTDTGIRFDAQGQMTHPGPDRVFVLENRRVAEAVAFTGTPGPNGIAWDAAGKRFLVNAFGAGTLFAWTPGAAQVDSIGAGPGGGDGLEVLADGRVLYTSWADSALHVGVNGTFTALVKGLPDPADIGVDPARGIVAVPLFSANRVEFWRLPPK